MFLSDDFLYLGYRVVLLLSAVLITICYLLYFCYFLLWTALDCFSLSLWSIRTNLSSSWGRGGKVCLRSTLPGYYFMDYIGYVAVPCSSLPSGFFFPYVPLPYHFFPFFLPLPIVSPTNHYFTLELLKMLLTSSNQVNSSFFPHNFLQKE